ncbi:MAG: ABC transporter permease, partial [Granulosicoccaceae bacterium]
MSNILVALSVITLIGLLIWSISKGRHIAATERTDAVFGNPSRAEGGWYWVICGVSSVLLIWFVFSWDAARAFVPSAANEICQAAKVTSAGNPIRSRFAIDERLDRSTNLLIRDRRQLDSLAASLVKSDIGAEQKSQAEAIIEEIKTLMLGLANPASVSAQTSADIDSVAVRLDALNAKLADPNYPGAPSAEQQAAADNLPGWGRSKDEVPVTPASAAGYKLDAAAEELKAIAKDFSRIRNTTPEFLASVKDLDTRIKALEKQSDGDFKRVVSNMKKLLKRVDDGAVFPADTMASIDQGIRQIDASTQAQLGVYHHVDNWLMPGGSILAGSTNCSEQGSGRWLPKPSDTLATLWQLAKPSEGYKGFPLLWYEWRQIGEVTEMLFPDWIADLVPGGYPVPDANGDLTPNLKSKTLAFVTGDYNSFSIPVPMGHVWDSLLRVLAGLFFGIALGVPLGLFMGLSRFAKGYFDPLIELYRPVPPLAWAPLILTIFGIQDDGKI